MEGEDIGAPEAEVMPPPDAEADVDAEPAPLRAVPQKDWPKINAAERELAYAVLRCSIYDADLEHLAPCKSWSQPW